MARRETYAPMDFQWDNGPAVDSTSPFAQMNKQPKMAESPASPPKRVMPNSFAAAAKQASPLKMHAFRAPQRSLFSPSISRQNSAPAFRNPAFTTPQTSRYMDVDDSPALTEASPAPETPIPETPIPETPIPETPDVDRSELMDSFYMSSPEPLRRNTYSDRRSGRGALSRGTALGFQQDRVRKRPRVDKDRDISSTRLRLPGGCDEDDSEYDEYDEDEVKDRKSKKNMGWLYYILTTISANPDAPIVFSYYLQLFIDACLGGLLLWGVWGAFTTARSEVIYAAEKAKSEKLAEIDVCARNFLANKCAPISSRLPALGPACDEWDTCMNQDPNSVAGVKASASQMAEVINAFTAQLSWKSIFFILMVVVAVLLANNMGFEKFRQNVRHYNHRPADPAPSHPAMGFPLSPEKPNQAYIFAPIGQTPRHLRRAFLQEDTDTDASPDQKLILPQRTPSRRSPSKGERSRSPSKRSPTKGYY